MNYNWNPRRGKVVYLIYKIKTQAYESKNIEGEKRSLHFKNNMIAKSQQQQKDLEAKLTFAGWVVEPILKPGFPIFFSLPSINAYP